MTGPASRVNGPGGTRTRNRGLSRNLLYPIELPDPRTRNTERQQAVILLAFLFLQAFLCSARTGSYPDGP